MATMAMAMLRDSLECIHLTKESKDEAREVVQRDEEVNDLHKTAATGAGALHASSLPRTSHAAFI